MCGIAGRINFKTQQRPDEDDLHAMCARMVHRGPDDLGTHIQDAVALGMRRLSIIDLAGGAQPIQNETGDVTVVFNGEIYNYRELRRELEGRGHVFSTQSDTEVIVHLYEDFGPALAEKLCGMFAIALYDRKLPRLLLIRDRVGKKPLFYYESPNGVLFASELKCFLDQPDFSAQSNTQAIHDFLCLGYVPGPGAALSGVYQVPPGGYLEIDANGIHARSYWSLNVAEDETVSEEEAAERIGELFRTAVARRLIADVPIGLYLSGGCDSIALLATVADLGGELLTAYTAGFDDRSYDETRIAERAAAEFGVPHVNVQCTPQDVETNIDDLIWHADNLLANPAMIPTYLLARRARRDLKVILNGGGGDELFFGYPTYNADVLAGRLSWIPRPCLTAAAGLTRLLLPVSFEKLSFSYKANKFLEGMRQAGSPCASRRFDREKGHYWWRTIFTERDRRRLFSRFDDPPDTYRAYRDAMRKRSRVSLLARANAADFEVWWRDMGLYLSDALNMAHGIEARLPFMDHELVEYVYRLPVRLKYQPRRLKGLFKRAMGGRVPGWVFEQKKAGFHVPLAPWFKNELNPMLRDTLAADRVRRLDMFDANEVQRLIDEHSAQRADNSYMLWNLICLVKWHEQFIQGARHAAPPTRTQRPRREAVLV